MFDRRDKLNGGQRVLSFFWPTMGWRRMGHYLKHRIGRIPGSPYEIAAGFACGAAISFSPFVGLHFIMGGVWAWLIRANIISSAIGTAVGNPWTFPFIWVWIYQCGLWLGIADGNAPADVRQLDFELLFGNMMEAIFSGDLDFLIETTGLVFWPMLVGSVPSIVVIWVAVYFPLKAMVESYQNARVQRRASSKATEHQATLSTTEKETMS